MDDRMTGLNVGMLVGSISRMSHGMMLHLVLGWRMSCMRRLSWQTRQNGRIRIRRRRL